MRIIAGTHRGRRIPFNNKRFGNARVTSDFVKEAVFGSLGVDLDGTRFLDLFAGSGQMGLEAVSRGGSAWMNEKDRKRAAFIRGVVDEWGLADHVTLTTEDSRRLLGRLSSAAESFDVIYVDPPYNAVASNGQPVSETVLNLLADGPLLEDTGLIFVQHDRRTALSESSGSLCRTKSRRYGDSLLSVYQKT